MAKTKSVKKRCWKCRRWTDCAAVLNGTDHSDYGICKKPRKGTEYTPWDGACDEWEARRDS